MPFWTANQSHQSIERVVVKSMQLFLCKNLFHRQDADGTNKPPRNQHIPSADNVMSTGQLVAGLQRYLLRAQQPVGQYGDHPPFFTVLIVSCLQTGADL